MKINLKVPAQQVTSAGMTQADVERLQKMINWRLSFYHEDAVVLVVDEEQRLIAPLYDTWLEERHAATLARMQTYADADRETDDTSTWSRPDHHEKVQVIKTISEALDEYLGLSDDE